jgi:hypothetical protein
MDNPVSQATPSGKKRGRPSKASLAEARKQPVGRPRGDASAIEEFKARLMASPKSRKVLDSILDAALDDEHKNQAAAWKLLVDRMLPMSYFEKDKGGSSRPSVNITISGVGESVSIAGSDDIVDVEEYKYDNYQFKKEMQFAPRYATQPEARSETSANTDYANKNGNTEKGDGYKYRGRSYIQLTGRGNYKKIGEELFLDGVIDDPDALVNNPDLLLDPVLGAKASIAYLNSKSGFKEVIEQPDLNKKSIALTKLINPGLFKEQKDFYLPENTKKNVLLNEGKNLRHKDNKGNRTGITFQEDRC